MRVLTVGNRPPDPSAGGYEVVWADLVAGLRERGHEVRILHPPALPSYWREGHWLRHGPLASWRIERSAARTVDRALRAGTDLVVWLNLGGLPMSLPRRARRVGVPALGVVHDGWMLYGPRHDRWHGLLRRRLAPGDLALWAFNSAYARDRTLESVSLGPAVVVPPGIDPGMFPPSPAGPWAWRLLYAGRVEEPKGVHVAVEALADLPDATLHVAGPAHEEYARPLRAAQRVTWEGPVPREALHQRYAAADALLFPVTWPEPFGLVPLEAMSVGRPVVATGTGGSAEYLRDGENCLLVPAGDAGALAAAVRRLAADPELRKHLVIGGRETAARYTRERFVERMCELAETQAAAGTVTRR